MRAKWALLAHLLLLQLARADSLVSSSPRPAKWSPSLAFVDYRTASFQEVQLTRKFWNDKFI